MSAHANDNGLSPNHFLSLSGGRFDKTAPSDLHSLFSTWERDVNRDRVVIHFHGGLVNEASGMRIAHDLYPVYRAAGAYPVFLVWKSGAFEVVVNNLVAIYKESLFQRMLHRVSQFAWAKVRPIPGSRGGKLDLPPERDVDRRLHTGPTPFDDVDPHALPQDDAITEAEADHFQQTLRNDQDLHGAATAIANALLTRELPAAEYGATRGARSTGSTRTLMSPEVLEEINRGERGLPGQRSGVVATAGIILKAGKVLANVVSRFARRRDHGFYPTVVEELLREFYLANVGGGIWSLMKQDVANAFGGDPEIHGGTAILNGFRPYMASEPRPRIVLVGHSTGAVYICHFLRHAAVHLPGVKFDVVFLAPACTFALFQETIDYFRNSVGDIRLFAMRDDLEIRDHLVPYIYPRSLLYFVSGVVETDVGSADRGDAPLLGMERYYSQSPPYTMPVFDATLPYLAGKPQRVCWSECSHGDGMCTNARTHGDFDDNPLTRASLQHIIRRGF